MSGHRRLVLLIGVMIGVSVVVGGIALATLYLAAIGEERSRLTDTVRSQARLIESIARFHGQYEDAFPGTVEDATLKQIEDAHQQYTGFGETGGFAIGRREGDSIIFLHGHRAGLERPKPIPFHSELAEPMRRALRGERGTLIGPDYLGTRVVAAYEPIGELELGIVAKIDLAEMRAPFARAAWIAGIVGFVVVLLGTTVAYRVSEPIIQNLRENEVRLRRQLEEIKRAEQTQRRLSAIVESSDDAIVGITLDGEVLTWNSGATRILGYSVDEIMGRAAAIFVPNLAAENPDVWNRLRNGESIDHCETAGRIKDGRLIHLSLNVSSVRDEEGQVVGASIIAHDITERKRAAESLRQSHELSESIINTARNIVLVVDTEGRIVRFNAYLEGLTDWRLEEVRGRDWFETFLPEPDRKRIRDLFGLAVRGERTQGYINTILTKDGHEREIEWYDAPLTDAEGRLIGILYTGRDVTERRILEREILEIAAEEQRRIGQELHDGTQQQLTGLGLLAQNVAAALTRISADPGEAQLLREAGLLDRIAAIRQTATRIRDGLDLAARQVNQLSRGLIPVELDSQGLMSSLAELARSVSHVQRVSCTFDCDAPIDVADNFTATHLYRIAQEAVNNALKHSGADRLAIRLSVSNQVISLKVLDNGLGIDDKRASGPGMGLRIMAYRADLIGGALRISRASDGGTEVDCTVDRS